MRGLIVDNFAGGGGASSGIEAAMGRPADIAVNHSRAAIAMHSANHPETKHFCEDVWEVDPRGACGSNPVDLAWFSPDCTHFSRAKGAVPRSKEIRGLAWVVIRWAKAVKPAVIVLENVEEFQTWGPLGEDGRPDPSQLGTEFHRWLAALRGCGYEVQYRILVAADHGAPTTRKRLFLVARSDGRPIVWPKSTHGRGTPLAWRTAAEVIDWSLPCPSIFGRKRPLADATLKRIAAGLRRYVIESASPFIVPVKTWGGGGNGPAGLDSPMRTVTASKRGEFALVSPTLISIGYGEREGQAPRTLDLHRPLGTVVGEQKHALVSAFLTKHYGNGVYQLPLDRPIGTVTAREHFTASHVALTPAGEAHDRRDAVRAFLVAYYGTERDGQSAQLPLRTVPTRDRFGLVTVHGVDYEIADIGLRMLAPRELFNAQGFDDGYVIDVELDGKPLTKTAQIELAGNSVCPPVAEAIVRANTRECGAVAA